MKILVVTDTWYPQVNGVVRTWDNIIRLLEPDYEVLLIHPGQFKTIPCPSYPEYRLAVFAGKKIKKTIEKFRPDAIHICNEAPLGITTMLYCEKNKIPFTTSFHTRFPEYIQDRWGFPADFSYAISREFHNRSCRTLVPTQSWMEVLEKKGFTNLELWTRGINRSIFFPRGKKPRIMRKQKHKKNLLYVGRIAQEKNLEEYCALSQNKEYQCIIVGEGPLEKTLKKKWKKVKFKKYKDGIDLAAYYTHADVCVFPSKTDTFGITIIESIACGTPVAGFPVTGPQDIILQGKSGYTDHNLAHAVEQCLKIPKESLPQYVDSYTWENCADILLQNLEPIDWGKTKLTS